MIIKIYNKFKNLSAPVKASIFFVICNVLQKGISLISAPIFTRLLTSEEYGMFSLFNSWYSIISIFVTFNLSFGVYIRGINKYDNDKDRFCSSMIGLSTTITTLFFIIYIIFYKFWNNIFGLSTLMMFFMFLEMFFTPAFAFWSNNQRNSYKYKMLVFVTLFMSISTLLVGIIAVLSTTYKAEARICRISFAYGKPKGESGGFYGQNSSVS